MTMHFHPADDIRSWGRIGRSCHAVARPRFTAELGGWSEEGRALAVGRRRSYSDVCLLDGGRLVDMTAVDRFVSFDGDSGLLVAEAGVTIDAILKAFVPRGWFVPVTPGTRFVTLGGAVANDVHGKNHHRAGTFGSHVRHLRVERSDAGNVLARPGAKAGLFEATVGGLGLTGVVTEVAVQLQRIPSAYLQVDSRACSSLDELCDGLVQGDGEFEHNVAWIDCTASGSELGRGLLSRGNRAADRPLDAHREPRRSLPTDRVDGLLNPLTLKLFNAAYHRLGRARAGQSVVHYEPFLYPLDSIAHWNRLYGRRGFYQYQCVIPHAAGREPIRSLLQEISRSGEGSFLAVLKRFGDRRSPGLLSFPRPGLTLALDFRNRGGRTLELLARLDSIVAAADGRLYPAKDGRMPRNAFERGYPDLPQFAGFVDPGCTSDFWKRMTA